MTYYVVELRSLECIDHSSGPGNDDIYVNMQTDKSSDVTHQIPPYPSVSTTHSWDIPPNTTMDFQNNLAGGKVGSHLQDGSFVAGSDMTFVFENKGWVSVYDYDTSSDDDYLGQVEITPNDPMNKLVRKQVMGSTDGGYYFLNFVLTKCC
ncbi:MAG: hypothetical protein JJ894_14680 [Dinoroseobacter sp.]|nr:hypothetical protein [Dinoroseobacter sp.]